ncbi:MAG: hypothetical protein QGG89_16150 [Vicinamibacterales bacterium]|jgi:hypothetical protein|nr:hypothetical protein [Vicinamibacterales bacterium]
MTYKADWVTGDILTAAQQNDLAKQAISRFADASARDAAITSPTEGQFCYLTGSNALQFYDGSSWTATSLTADITEVAAGTNIDVTSGTGPVPSVAVSIDAELACADQVVSRAQMKDYAETVNALGSKSAAFNIDFEDGNVQTVTISSGTFNVGLINSLASHSNSITILGTNLGAGTPSFVAGAHGGGGNAVKWADGTAPTYTASGTDVLCFTTFDGGTNFYGFAAGLDFS